MQQINLVIRNKVGLHARPATLFVKAAKGFKSKITVKKDSRSADAKSILSVLALGAGQDASLLVTADGEDEAQALESLRALVDKNFGEPE
jgi:phosphocarrier protein